MTHFVCTFHGLCVYGLGRKRGRKPDDEDPEIKRQRFLERNRAAASRCRAKKKVWVDSLENKCKEIEMYNQNLTQEVAMLRSEVQQLKSILIAHKDCPLIVQQSQTSAGKNTACFSLDAETLFRAFRFKWRIRTVVAAWRQWWCDTALSAGQHALYVSPHHQPCPLRGQRSPKHGCSNTVKWAYSAGSSRGC